SAAAPAPRRRPLFAMLSIGFLLGVGVLFAWNRSRGGSGGARETTKVLAVLPFENMGSADQEYFADGVTDEVRGKLANLQTRALDVALGSSAREQLVAAPTANLAAYQAFLRGEQLSTQLVTGNALGLRRAMRFYEEAVQRDSTFVEAWTQLSRVHSALFAFVGP